jgi:hypothetical protein
MRQRPISSTAVENSPRLSRTGTRCSPRTGACLISSRTVCLPSPAGQHRCGQENACPAAAPDRTVCRCRFPDLRCGRTALGRSAVPWTSACSLASGYFLFFDRHARRIDAALQGISALKRVPVPELDCRQAQRQAFASCRQTGMHQNTAAGVMSRTTLLAEGRGHLLQDSDRPGIFMPVRQLRRIVKNQNREATAGGKSLSRARETTCEDIGFADLIVAKEA